ncbi:ATP-binding protein [Zoogloea sp.]|uniref:sensor histidine kinase n=1 Tax=Zoogloea sp. TaxID=49181 RepID=UPI0026336207|nr:ATP-binding protein [Zoogloea sp.]MDD3354767.1 ATP-binding protein [Zoogloea sp.]
MERIPLPRFHFALRRRTPPARSEKVEHGSKRRSLYLAIGLAFFCLTGFVAGGAKLLIEYDKEQALRRSESDLVNLTRVLDEHVARAFGETETALAELARLIEDRGSLESFGEEELVQPLRSKASHLPSVSYLQVERTDGSPAATSIAPDQTTNPPRAPIRQRPFSLGVQEGIQIDPPVRSPYTGEWVIPLSRQVFDESGKYLGSVSAAISHAYFDGIYRELALPRGDVLQIVHSARGLVLVQHPPLDAAIGSPWKSVRNLKDLQGEPGQSQSGLDRLGTERLSAWRQRNERPVLVSSSRLTEDALADYVPHRNRILVSSLALITLLAALAMLLQRYVHRREQDNQMLEERVRQRTAQLEQVNRELLSFSYSISHDLSAPLRSINGFAHALEEDSGDRLDEAGRQHLRRLKRASLRMEELIDALLRLSSVNQHALKIQHLDLSGMAQEILDDLSATQPERVIVSHVEEGLQAEADPVLLRSALENLLGNAWKFTRDSQPALIHFGGRPHGDENLYYVSDNGIGFRLDHARRLFEPFQRLHQQEGFQGSGIGLASVRRIIERHGGSVWVESAPGKGTSLFFTLPRPPALVRRPREREQIPGRTYS